MALPVPPAPDLLALWPETLMTVTACGALVADIVTPRDRKRLIGWGCFVAVCVTLFLLLVAPPQGGVCSPACSWPMATRPFSRVCFSSARL